MVFAVDSEDPIRAETIISSSSMGRCVIEDMFFQGRVQKSVCVVPVKSDIAKGRAFKRLASQL